VWLPAKPLRPTILRANRLLRLELAGQLLRTACAAPVDVAQRAA
jgi:hypothetical protein